MAGPIPNLLLRVCEVNGWSGKQSLLVGSRGIKSACKELGELLSRTRVWGSPQKLGMQFLLSDKQSK